MNFKRNKGTPFGDIDGCVLASATHDRAARDAFFQHTFQPFGSLELLSGVALHTQEEHV